MYQDRISPDQQQISACHAKVKMETQNSFEEET